MGQFSSVDTDRNIDWKRVYLNGKAGTREAAVSIKNNFADIWWIWSMEVCLFVQNHEIFIVNSSFFMYYFLRFQINN